MNELIKVSSIGDIEVLTVCSKDVAESFGKRHDHVLRDIDSIREDVPNFGEMFIKAESPDAYGRMQKVYDMTRDGFSILAMGFTGKEALAWKVKYISAFNQLEKAWNTPEMVMSRALKMAETKIKQLSITNSELTVQNAIMQPKAEYFDALVDRGLLTNFRDTAKEYGVRERDFIAFLLDKRYVYRDGKGRLMPYAQKNDGLFEVKESMNERTGWTGTQTLITPKGRETFRLLVGKAKRGSA